MHYDQDYFTDSTTKNPRRFETYLGFLEKSLGLNLPALSVCDLGCATGTVIELLVRKGNNDCYGVDISNYALQECKKKFPNLKDHFRQIDLNYQSLSINQKFDLITMFDVIEHLNNFAYLKEIIRNNLKGGAYFAITTPNANSFLRIFFPRIFIGEIDPTHTTLFTPYTLDFFLRRTGLEKVSLYTPYSFYFKMDKVTRVLLLGGQIFAVYRKSRPQ